MIEPYRIPGEMEKEIVIEKRRNWEDIIKVTFWVSFMIALATSMVAMAAVPLFMSMFSDGKADYCYVEPVQYTEADPNDARRTGKKWVTGYVLKQHIPWHGDRTLVSDIPTPGEVRQEAEKFACPIR